MLRLRRQYTAGCARSPPAFHQLFRYSDLGDPAVRPAGTGGLHHAEWEDTNQELGAGHLPQEVGKRRPAPVGSMSPRDRGRRATESSTSVPLVPLREPRRPPKPFGPQPFGTSSTIPEISRLHLPVRTYCVSLRRDQ